MNEKKAFIFDTNFIIQVKELDKVIKNLNNGFTVYVTQVSIDERISQECLSLKKLFDDIPMLVNKYQGFANLEIISDYPTRCDIVRKGMQSKYQAVFGLNIIPFKKDGNTLSSILERVFHKQPPFAAGESDRGFKDTLLWLSVLDFFSECGENHVVFLTNDNGFIKSVDTLCKEFNEKTGKTIEISENSYYHDLIKPTEPTVNVKSETLPDVTLLRERIQMTISAVCYGEYGTGSWMEPNWVRTFVLNEQIESKDIEDVFSNLKETLNRNLFESSLPADDILTINRNAEGLHRIPTDVLQEALILYEDIKKDYSDYLPQFYSAAANIFNQNYIVTQNIFENEDFENGELQF